MPEESYRPTPWHDSFISFTVKHGFVSYLKEQIHQSGRNILQKKGRPLLEYALCPEPSNLDCLQIIRPNLEMVRLLLDIGADPNEKFANRTPWNRCLSKLARNTDHKVLEIMKELILCGADPNGRAEFWSGGRRYRLKIVYTALRLVTSRIRLAMVRYAGEVAGEVENEKARQLHIDNVNSLVGEIVKLLKERKAVEQEWRDDLLVYPKDDSVKPPELESGRPTVPEHGRRGSLKKSQSLTIWSKVSSAWKKRQGKEIQA